MKLHDQPKVQIRKAIAGRVKKKTTGQKWEPSSDSGIPPTPPPPHGKSSPLYISRRLAEHMILHQWLALQFPQKHLSLTADVRRKKLLPR